MSGISKSGEVTRRLPNPKWPLLIYIYWNKPLLFHWSDSK